MRIRKLGRNLESNIHKFFVPVVSPSGQASKAFHFEQAGEWGGMRENGKQEQPERSAKGGVCGSRSTTEINNNTFIGPTDKRTEMQNDERERFKRNAFYLFY